jgi:hypothetical protein
LARRPLKWLYAISQKTDANPFQNARVSGILLWSGMDEKHLGEPSPDFFNDIRHERTLTVILEARVRAPTSEQRDVVRGRMCFSWMYRIPWYAGPLRPRHAGFKCVACDLYKEEAKRRDGTIFHRVDHMVLTHSDLRREQSSRSAL